MNNFLVIPNKTKSRSLELTREIIKWLSLKGINCFVQADIGKLYGLEEFIKPEEEALQLAECAIILGGDGTILSAARKLSPYHIPILAVNLGRLGFLAEVDAKDIISTLEQIEEGNFCIESRMMLETKIVNKDEVLNLGLALNDVVATRGAISRMVGYRVYVNNELVNTYYADGIIISTPTGSTAYNLSAGGPILTPHNEMIVITPICPHSLTARSIVVSSKDKIRITFGHNLKSIDKDIQLTIDGQQVIPITNETEIYIEKSNVYTKLIQFKNIDFFTLLRKKLAGN